MLKIHTYTNTFYWPEVNTTILAEALSLMLSQTPTKWVKDLKVLQCSVRLIWVVVSEGIVGFSLSVTLETSHSSFMRRRRGYFQSHEAEHTHAICRQMMLGNPHDRSTDRRDPWSNVARAPCPSLSDITEHLRMLMHAASLEAIPARRHCHKSPITLPQRSWGENVFGPSIPRPLFGKCLEIVRSLGISSEGGGAF